MRAMYAIAAKECRVYLTTWTSYILFGGFMFATAFFFSQRVALFQLAAMETMQRQQGMMDRLNLTDFVVNPVFMDITVFFLFMIPIMTMRQFAEERRTKTLELLMTAPVRPLDIVLGKFLGCMVILLIMLGLTIIFPILLTVFGGATGQANPVDWAGIAVAYFGMFLLGASFVAVGLFASSVTDSQIVAVIIGFIILIMFFVIGIAGRGQEGFWKEFLDYISITNHLEPFVRGVLRIPDVAYYLSLGFVGLFFTYRVIEAQRWR